MTRAAIIRSAGLFAVLFMVSWVVFRAPHDPPRANVRWADHVTAEARATLQRQYGLTEPHLEGGRTFSYALNDTSVTNLQRLVHDRAVEDTHKIDRSRFQPTREEAAGTLFRPSWFVVWSTLMAIVAAVLTEAVARSRLSREGRTRSVEALRSTVARGPLCYAPVFARLVTRAIPELPAEALGLFRMFLGASLFVAVQQARPSLIAGHVPEDGQLGWEWIRWLAARPDVVAELEKAIFLLLGLFVVGLFTRIVYPLAAATLIVWMLVWIESQHSNGHVWLVTMLTVICLVPVRWDVAFSLDEMLRRWRGCGYGAGQRGKSYGYAVWIPGLVLGSVWASAAYAKMVTSGPEWILGGAVKYHWVIDAQDAVVDWGLWVARHHWAAVLLSFCGVAFEAAFVLAAFARSWIWRTGFAAAGLGLIVGFYLFHGVLWWPWLLVYLSFVIPWTRVHTLLSLLVPARTFIVDVSPSGLRTARFRYGLDWFNRLRFVDGHGADAQMRLNRPRPTLNGRLGMVQGLLIAAVCVHASVELPAGFGRFGSYSNTYSSVDEFDRTNPLKTITRVWIRHGTEEAVEIEANIAVDAIERLAGGEPLPSHYASELRDLDAFADLSRDEPRRLTLTRQRRAFDWERGRFNPLEPRVAATLDVDSMTLVTNDDRG